MAHQAKKTVKFEVTETELEALSEFARDQFKDGKRTNLAARWMLAMACIKPLNSAAEYEEFKSYCRRLSFPESDQRLALAIWLRLQRNPPRRKILSPSLVALN